MQAVQPSPTLAPDALAQARAAAARGDAAEALSRYLRVLAASPDSVPALAGAGQAALAVGDVNAAAGFLARAEALDPRSGPVKAALARTELQEGNARAALRLFGEAAALGVPVATIAADRGLAYDLRGQPRRAQADYAIALAADPGDREATRRLALSEAIAGDRTAAMATLDPLLRVQDVPAWRARAFVFALTGDPASALTGAGLVMPKDQVTALMPYLPRLAALKPADKAAAIHLGRFPGEGAPPVQTAVNAPKLPIDKAVLVASPPPPPRPTIAIAPPAPVPAPVPAATTAAAASATVPVPVPVPVSVPAPAIAPPPPAPVRIVAASPDPAGEAAPAAPARADGQARRQAERASRAERLAEERRRREREDEAAERIAARRNPARHWVQVAGGANKHDLGKAWHDLKARWPRQLAGRTPWTLHYRYTNRLLIGPFASSDAAQDWVSERRGEGFATFRVETNAGDPVERVSG